MTRGRGIETEFDSETLSKEKYEEFFGPKPDEIVCKEKTKWEKAYERACKNREFEIELYWKRATYF